MFPIELGRVVLIYFYFSGHYNADLFLKEIGPASGKA